MATTPALKVYCADVGSIPAGKFAWAWGSPGHAPEDGGESIEELARHVATDLNASVPVALGFECPLFVPLPRDPRLLGTARSGEGNRPWSAGAGAGALATGLTEVAWVLRAVRERLTPDVPAFLRWDCFRRANRGLLVWEAFISGPGRGGSHASDARRAVELFLAGWPALERVNMIRQSEALSLVGAGLVRSGWTTDVSVLSSPCLVVGEYAGGVVPPQAREASERSARTGEHNSLLTRVAPAFCELLGCDPTGQTWLPSLLVLPAREGRARLRMETPEPLEEARFGASEKALAAPRTLLKWLVEHPEQLARRGDPGRDSRERAALLAGDQSMRLVALGALDGPKVPERAWYVFEGSTYPDVFLKTPNFIVVIEGKRTESGITTDTEWMPVRHQMLRHLDGAWELRGRRRILGFFIVEADGGSEITDVPLKWRKQCDETVRGDVLESSLPHRQPAERAEIADGYLGVTTWQEVCRVLGISFDSLPQRV